jgi:polar amino acid transport system permease protein
VTQRWQLPVIFAAVAGGGLAIADLTDSQLFLPSLLAGAWITIEITVMAAVLAAVCSVTAAIAKLYGILPVRWLAVAYIETFRGTSALVQLFWLYFVFPYFGVSMEPITAAVVALGLNIGAYGAEVVRGAIQAVPRGQWEAATALNMTRAMALRRIVLPQAFVAMIPPWGNLLIELLKSTALVSLITIGDLTFRAQQMNQTTIRTVEIFTLTLIIYLCLSLVIIYAVRLVERWAATGLARGRAA